jgi:hypothetical protein
MPAPQRREVYLAIGRVTIECPRLMTDVELAAVLAAFVETVRARPPKESIPLKELPGPLPAFRKRKPPR